MTRRRYSFWIEQEQLEAMTFVHERDGVLPSEQIRRALDAWLRGKGVKRSERKRAGTRKRP